MKNQKAITLVALIITVIVLLILATVSINLIINSGIIGKTKSEVDKYSDEEVSEQIKMSYLEYQTEKLYKSNLNLKEFMEQSLGKIYGEVTITPYSETEVFPMLIEIGKREFLLKGDGTSSAKHGITEYDVAKHPETYYGKYVTNYNSPNDAGILGEEGQLGKWQIFMANEDNIYLIASNYINFDYAPKKNNVAYTYDTSIEDTSTVYKMWFSNIQREYPRTTSNMGTLLSKFDNKTRVKYHKWMNNADNQIKNYSAISSVASMIDTDIWNVYKNNTYGKYAIGGPTIEMFCESYNKMCDEANVTEKLVFNENTDYGYRLRRSTQETDENATGCKSSVNNLANKMYYSNNNHTAAGYWIASPYNYSNISCVCQVKYYGPIGRVDGWNDTVLGFRPIVCLKDNVHLVEHIEGNTTTYTLELD